MTAKKRFQPRLVTALATAALLLLPLSGPPSAHAAPDSAPAASGADAATVPESVEATALLAIIDRFVDRAEDFWVESTGTFNAAGSGVTQPRGKGNIALAYATLLTARPDQQTFGREGHPRELLLDHVDRTIREAARSNKSQGGNWGGGTWQAALETYNWGLAAYLLRDQLSAATLDVAGTVIRYEADILITKRAATGTTGNTAGEDNAWNTPLPVLAAGWWPEHENAEAWRNAAKRMAVNAATVPGDTTDDETTVDGRPLSDWAESTNLLPDLTMENHGFFNPIYQQVAGFNVGEGLLLQRMTGQPDAEAMRFRTEEIYDKVLAPMVTPDGDLLLTHGQDWVSKDYQHLGYLTLMGTAHQRPDATEYARQARRAVAGRQAAHDDGSILGQPAVGYESMLVKRMASAYLMHRYLGEAAETDEAGLEAIESARDGVYVYESSRLAVHRIGGTLRSVNWTSTRPTALMVPDGSLHDDPVLSYYEPGNLLGGQGSTGSCDCREDSFAAAQILAGRGVATASLSNGLMPALDAGSGASFPIALESIPGVTGERPVSGPRGPVTGTTDVPWVNVAGRLGMVVTGGAGVKVTRDIVAGANRLDRLTGSVPGGEGRRAAVLVADHTDAEVARVAASTTRPAAPAGWQAVQATALDGTIGVLAARFGGQGTSELVLPGGPVLPSGVVVGRDSSRWALELNQVAARAEVAPATATATNPVIASAPRPDLVTLTNDGEAASQVSVTFANGATTTGTLAPGASKVAVLSDGEALFGHPALIDLVAALDGPANATQHVEQAIDALVEDDEEIAIDQILVALKNGAGTSMTEPLSAAAAELLGLTLQVPATVEVVRGDIPQDVAADLAWSLGAGRTAARADLTLRSELADSPVTATDRPFAPGERLTATIPVTAAADSPGGVMEATARVRVGPGTIVLTEQAELVAVDPVALDVAPAQVVVGGSILRPFEVTLSNRLSRPLDLEVGITGPDGLSIGPSTSTLTVPARGSEMIRPTLAREGVSDGRHTLVITATATDGEVRQVRTEVDVFTSDEIAVNPVGTGFPRASATSAQDSQPARLANDGDASTFWVSAGTQAGEGPSPQAPQVLTVELGAPAPLGAVTVVPRTGYGPRDMVIEGRIDGTWQTLAAVSQADGTQQHAVPQSAVDAVRLRITSSHDRVQPSRNVQVAEIRLSEEGAPPSPVATASSSQSTFPPDLAVDGNPATFWVSQTGATEAQPQWLAVDLGRPLSITRLAVTPRLNGTTDHGPRAMVWQVGDGHGGWSDVARREKPLRAGDAVDVAVRAQYVRLLITSVWDSRNLNVQVAELSVTGRSRKTPGTGRSGSHAQPRGT